MTKNTSTGRLTKREAMDFVLGLVRDGTLRIDDKGFVWRCTRIIHGKRKRIEPHRAENPGSKGYLRITVQGPNSRLVQVMAHRLVWEAANGCIPDGMQINHKDLCSSNNALSNLEVVNAQGNIKHSYANGRRRPWSDATSWRGQPRVSAETKSAMRQARRDGLLLRQISERFGVSVSHAQRVCAES